MEHCITVENFGVRLRPVRLQDAEFLVSLRNSPHADGFIGDSARDVESQMAWLSEYFGRKDDFYFIIEKARDSRSVGTSSVYDIQGRNGEWGRFVIQPGEEVAPASIWLSFQVGFEILHLDILRALVVESNTVMQSIHKRMGSQCLGLTTVPRVIGGKATRLMEFRIDRVDWPRISEKLGQYARLAEKFIGSKS